MVDIVSLAEARTQVRLSDDDLSEDALFVAYIAAAQRVAFSNLGLAATAVIPDEDLGVVRQAMLMMIGHWYMEREAAEPPQSAIWLLGTIRKRSL